MDIRRDARSDADGLRHGDNSAPEFSWPPAVDFAADEIAFPAEPAPETAHHHAAANTDHAAPPHAQTWTRPTLEPASRPPASQARLSDSDSSRRVAPKQSHQPGAHGYSRASRALLWVLGVIVLAEGILVYLELTGRGVFGNATPSHISGVAHQSASNGARVQGSDVNLDPGTRRSDSPGADAVAAAPMGDLQVRTDKPGAVVLLDGHRRGTTPLTIRGLSPGLHRIRLTASGHSVDEEVTTEPGVITSLIVRMPSDSAVAVGWVDVVMPFEVQIFEEGRLVGTSSQSRLQFPAGEHLFALSNGALGYRAVERVRVRADDVATLRPHVPMGLVSINALPWAEVWIDGTPVGTTPLGNLKATLGTHEVRFRHPELGEQTRQVVVTASEPARVAVEFGR